MIKIEASNMKQKVCDNCGGHDGIKFIKVGEPEVIRSFALCKKCRNHLCKVIMNEES